MPEGGKDLHAMTNQTTRKCAHIACFCDVPNGQEYCGDARREAGRENVDIDVSATIGHVR